MDTVPLYQGHSIFRNQPPFTFFNQTFEESQDVLFQQLEEINPVFLKESFVQNNDGFTQNILLDPRTKAEQLQTEYDHSAKGKKYAHFKGGGIKSALTKEQHKIGLRILLAQQERQELNEADLILYNKFQSKLQKERRQMHEYIKAYAEEHKEEIYAATKRLDELYRHWFQTQRFLCIKQEPNNLAFNTHAGLPLVSLCKTLNNETSAIADVELLARRGWLRFYRTHEALDWQNLNFGLKEFAFTFNEAKKQAAERMQFVAEAKEELESFDDKSNGLNIYLPFETLLFLFSCGGIYLPTEVLLEICNSTKAENGKVITFEKPLPAHNCGYHTQQLMVEQAFAAFLSAKGRATWLTNDEEINDLPINISEAQEAGGLDLSLEFKPLKYEDYLLKNENLISNHLINSLKENTALTKWYLNSTDEGIKILSSLSLPPITKVKAPEFLAFEFIKLETKPEFGCEEFTKHELLKAWFQMHLMSFAKTTNFGIFYRLSAKDLSLQLKQHLTLAEIELNLKQNHRTDPYQLLANLREFLKLLANMPAGKFMLRYNPKYNDKFLLCMNSQEIAPSTVYLHGLFEAEPTNLAFMTQPHFLDISESLCSAVHTASKIIPCAFLPLLPGQKHLETADKKLQQRKKFLAKITEQSKTNIKSKEKQINARKRAMKRKRRKLKTKTSQKSKDNEAISNDEDDMIPVTL